MQFDHFPHSVSQTGLSSGWRPGEKNLFQFAYFTTIKMETGAHMCQIVSTATPVQPAKEDIPSPGAQINAHTLIHLETTLRQ